MVGTSGSSPARLTASTASPRNFPALILPSAGGRAVKAICVSPAMVELIACAAPGNGTCTRSRPNFCLNNSPDKCGVEPMPGPAKLYLFGLALISAISSLTLFAGTDGLTTMTLGEYATMVIG